MNRNIMIPYVGNNIKVSIKERKEKTGVPKTMDEKARIKKDKCINHLTKAQARFIQLNSGSNQFDKRLAFVTKVNELIKMLNE